jgi:hypothetical protein
MIDTAINHLAATLNQALKRVFSVGEDLVVASCLHEQDGSVATHAANKLAVFLVNIERDTLPQSAPRVTSGPRVGLQPAPVCLNLMVMFAAHFGGSHYGEALKLIASTIAFFQSRPVLDHHNTPDLDPRIDRLALDIENLSLGDLGNVWGLLGGKYVPSVLYRVRMVSIDAGQVFAEVPRIVQPELLLG